MYSTLPEFHKDLEKVSSLLDMIQILKEYAGIDAVLSSDKNDEYSNFSVTVHDKARENHSNLVLLSGILVLFVSGIFETFVRNSFEELCTNASSMADRFHHLPKKMRENLTKFTAEVMSNPRKYGHADQGIKTFVKTLADNLTDNDELTAINYKCLSITSENMRSQMLSDLFNRVGIKNIWETIGEQAKLKLYFETSDSNNSGNKAKKYLDNFMDIRNKIAHPSPSFNWPDIDYVRESVKYFFVLSQVLIDAIEVQEINIKQKIKDAR